MAPGLTCGSRGVQSQVVHDAASPNSDRKADIIRRLQAGERAGEIARALGVTRQYVSLIKVRLENEGVDAVSSPGRRGRPKDRPLSPGEADSLHARIVAGPPDANGPNALWSDRELIRWFKETHGRPLTVHQLRKFCTERRLRLAPPPDAHVWTGGGSLEEEGSVPASFPSRRRRSRTAAPQRLSEDDVEAMARANAEVARRMQETRKQEETLSEAAGSVVRLGPKPGRNDPCPFDPAKKFKRCCGASGATRCLRTGG